MAPASPDGAIAATTFEPSISGTENLPNAEANSVPASSVLTPPASQTEPAVSTPAARQQTAAPLPEPESPAEIQRSPVTLTSFDLTQPTVTERAAADRSGRAKAGPSATPRRIAPTEPPAASPTTSAQATGPAESTPPNVSGSSLQRSPADLSTPDLTEAVNPAAKPPDSLAEMTESETSNPETAAVEASASPAGISPSSNLSVAPPEPAQSPTLQTKLTANASTRAPDDRDRSIEPEPLGKAVANNEALTETVSNNLEIVNSQAQSAPEAPETRSNAPEPGPNHIPEAINLQAQSVSETTSETADLSLLQPPTAAPQSLAELQNRATELSDSTVPAATVTASPQVAPIQTKAESGRVVPAPNSAAAQTGWPQLPQVLQPISNLLSPPPQRQATSEPLPTSKSLLQRKVPALSSSLTGYKPLFAAKSATPVSPGSSALMLQTQIEGTSATGEAMPETADIPGDWGSIAELMQISRPAATAVQPEPAIASPVKPENAYRDLQPFEGDRHLQAQGIMSAPVTHVSAQRLQAFTEPPATPVTSEPASAAEGNQSAATSAANIEKLAQAVYFRLRQRLALERERRGNNYSGRF
ncbi:MAG: hypothetical protein HC816_14510 [Leptolyngbyaceae cyanobacterium RM1_1_2]|nr:hypothetical protein [Leptolyngbyaceae cyanobacterium RM1_1_2]